MSDKDPRDHERVVEQSKVHHGDGSVTTVSTNERGDHHITVNEGGGERESGWTGGAKPHSEVVREVAKRDGGTEHEGGGARVEHSGGLSHEKDPKQ
jgi:hypothetical protein